MMQMQKFILEKIIFHIMVNYKGGKNMILLMVVILLYHITNFKLLYYLGWVIAIGWLSVLEFIIGAFISVYINLF